MNPKDFIAHSVVNDLPNKDYSPVVDRLKDSDLMRIIHASMGLSGEAGEVLDIVKKSMAYGKPLDKNHIIEEAGDCLWYMAILFDTLGVSFEEVMQRNVDKLAKRYPKGFTTQAAIERKDKA